MRETARSAHVWAVVSWERMLPYRGNRLITKVGNKRRQFDRRSGHAKNLLPKQVLRPKQIQQPKRAQQPAKNSSMLPHVSLRLCLFIQQTLNLRF